MTKKTRGWNGRGKGRLGLSIRALTLVELLVVLAIAGIVMSAGTASFAALIKGQRRSMCITSVYQNWNLMAGQVSNFVRRGGLDAAGTPLPAGITFPDCGGANKVGDFCKEINIQTQTGLVGFADAAAASFTRKVDKNSDGDFGDTDEIQAIGLSSPRYCGANYHMKFGCYDRNNDFKANCTTGVWRIEVDTRVTGWTLDGAPFGAGGADCPKAGCASLVTSVTPPAPTAVSTTGDYQRPF